MTTATAPAPSITWAEAGPEIERRQINITHIDDDTWCADCPGPEWKVRRAFGSSALEAVEKLLREIGGENG
jgi:hypothetical protein